MWVDLSREKIATNGYLGYIFIYVQIKTLIHNFVYVFDN